MARSEIPAAWRERVCALLKDGAHGQGKEIEWTLTAGQRFEADSFGDWPYEATDAIRAFLSSGTPAGRQVRMGEPPGETYEFIFPYKGRDFYGKILLVEDLKSVILLSAHLPLKPGLQCD